MSTKRESALAKKAGRYREELETAWLRGWLRGHDAGKRKESASSPTSVSEEAAGYAERVVGGSTRPERPEVER